MTIKNEEKFNKVLIIVSMFILSALVCLILSIGLTASNTKMACADPDNVSQADLEEAQAAFNQISIQLVEANDNLARVREQKEEAQRTIDYCNSRIPEVQDKLAKTVVHSYKNKEPELADIILGCDSISGLINSMQMLGSIQSKHTKDLHECIDLKKQQKEKLDEISAAEEEEAQNVYAISATYQNADELVKRYQSVIDAQRRASQEATMRHNGTIVPHGGPAPYLGDVVATARACIGHDYVFGAAGPNVFDCSGLVCWCYGLGGSHAWNTNTFCDCRDGWFKIDASEAVPGDVVSHSGHCGIYIGGGQMIHSPMTGCTVTEAKVQAGMNYYRHG